MKTTILLIALLSLISCRAQDNNNKTTTQTDTTMIRPILTPEFEKLNLEDFKDGLVITKLVGDTAPYIGVKLDSYSYRKINEVGTIALNGTLLDGFGYSFTANDSYYAIAKGYYGNSYIRSKCIRSSIIRSIKIGKQYFFNQDGKLEKTIDHDLGWDYSYEKVIQYILDRKAPLLREEYYFGAEITQEGKEKKYWQLVIDTGKITGKPTWELIKLDGMTGEILCQIEFEGDRQVHADTEFIPAHEKIIKEDRTTSKIYRTYKGKSYTYDQWLKFQEEFHEELKQNKK
jgi:hypothetical protein